MADLIDRDALMKKVCASCSSNDCVPDATDTVYGCVFADAIQDAPAVNRWIPCSEKKPELIDRQVALKKMCGDCKSRYKISHCPCPFGMCHKYESILQVPTIEPERGEWVETEPDEDDRKIGIEFSIKCSRCHDENSHLDFNENHEITGKTFWKSRFCPNCGADMREEGVNNIGARHEELQRLRRIALWKL